MLIFGRQQHLYEWLGKEKRIKGQVELIWKSPCTIIRKNK